MRSLSTKAPRRKSTALRGGAANEASNAMSADLIATFDSSTIVHDVNTPEALEAERLKAFEQGYQDGLEQAHAEVAAAVDDSNKRVRRALAALCDAVDSFDERQTIALGDVEDAIVTGSLMIAQAVLQRELSLAMDPGAEAIARAMRLAPDRGNVIARLNPDDLATLQMDSISTTTRTVDVIADPTIEPGGCIVEVADTQVDTQLSSVLARVIEVLIGEGPNTGAVAVAGSDSNHTGMTVSETAIG